MDEGERNKARIRSFVLGTGSANESIGEKSRPTAVRGKEEGAKGVPCDDEGDDEIKRPEL